MDEWKKYKRRDYFHRYEGTLQPSLSEVIELLEELAQQLGESDPESDPY